MKKHREINKKIIALMIVVITVISSVLMFLEYMPTHAKAVMQQEMTYIGDGYNVKFAVTSSWDGAFNVNVIIDNTSETVIENWALSFAMPHQITNIWNGQISYSNESLYVIKNSEYNQDIPVAGSVEFGFTAKCENEIIIPKSYMMIMEEEIVNQERYNISTRITSNWGSTYQGEIIIENIGEDIIEDWKLSFNYSNNIEQFWTANIIEKNDDYYVIKNDGYNSNIVQGERVILGFQATGNDAFVSVEKVILGNIVINENLFDLDRDEDGISNKIELYLGTNIESKDTDNDGIDDYSEILYNLDPLSNDTDFDAILDGNEDIDNDKLDIFKEFYFGTDNLKIDTDLDGITDYEEIYVYGTDPLINDTDNDGVKDGVEIKLFLNPLLQDSNGDGTLDRFEKIEQTVEILIHDDERKEIDSVTITMKGTGDINETTTIENTYGLDIMSSNVVGLFGVPVEIKSTSQFDYATIEFKYNEEYLGNVKEENLRIMWYDEENGKYVIFDDESVLDFENNTISYTTNHFSTYLVVDRQAWYDTWSNSISYYRQPTNSSVPTEYFDICYVIDRSGSMSGARIENAKSAIEKFVSAMYKEDRGAIVAFDSSATAVSSFTNDKEALKNSLKSIYASGGTDVERGLLKAIELFDNAQSQTDKFVYKTKVIVLLCDGDINYTQKTIDKIKDKKIKVYPVLIGSTTGEKALNALANETGGIFYYAATAEEIRETIFGIQQESIGNIDTTDTDRDGLYDIYETAGMIIQNGTYVYSDPQRSDTDGDGLTDAEEMGIKLSADAHPFVQMYLKLNGFDDEIYAECFFMNTNPNKEDTDDDGYDDYEDIRPAISDVWTVKLADSEKFVEIWNGNTNYYGGDQEWYSKEIAKNGACGTVAAANIMAYMSLYDDKYDSLYSYLDFSYSNFVSHMYDMYEYLSPWYIPFTNVPLGIWPMSKFEDGVETYAKCNGVRLRGVRDDSKYNKKNVSRYIKEGLDKNKPIAMLIGFNSKMKNIEVIQPNGNSWIQEDFTKHWVTITEITVDEIKDSVVLKVSTWGGYAYIDLDSFIDGEYIYECLLYFE